VPPNGRRINARDAGLNERFVAGASPDDDDGDGTGNQKRKTKP
jgi:hypothetical protein